MPNYYHDVHGIQHPMEYIAPVESKDEPQKPEVDKSVDDSKPQPKAKK